MSLPEAFRSGEWTVRSLPEEKRGELCPYCPRRSKYIGIPATAEIAYQVIVRETEKLVGERSSPVCLDHAVLVQQQKILEPRGIA